LENNTAPQITDKERNKPPRRFRTGSGKLQAQSPSSNLTVDRERDLRQRKQTFLTQSTPMNESGSRPVKRHGAAAVAAAQVKRADASQHRLRAASQHQKRQDE